MADIKTKNARSANMAAIHGKDTQPEVFVRKYLFAKGFRYRKNDKRLPGTPDIVLPKYKTVVFVNGCFWHGHQNCKYFVWPKSNVDFWERKIKRNIEHDKKVYDELQQLGWTVIIIWECELKKTKREFTLIELCRRIKHEF